MLSDDEAGAIVRQNRGGGVIQYDQRHSCLCTPEVGQSKKSAW
jgi:hypothetical protein